MKTRTLRITVFICISISAGASLLSGFNWPLFLSIGGMYALFGAQVMTPTEKTPTFKLFHSIASGLCLGLWGYSIEGFFHLDTFILTAAAFPAAMFGFRYGIIALSCSLIFRSLDLITGGSPISPLLTIIVLAFACSVAAIGSRNLIQAVQETREKEDLNFLLNYNLSIGNCESEIELAEITYASFKNRFGVRTGVVVAGQDETIKLIPLADNPLACLSNTKCENMLNSFAWEAFQSHVALKIEQPASSPLIPIQARDGLHGLSLYAIPMRNLHDMVGIVLIYATEEKRPDDATLEVMQAAAGNLARALTNLSLVKRFRSLAMYDELTGLCNRRAFFNRFAQEMARAKRYNQPLGFAILDLDFFKAVNDDFGHRTGDEVLKKVAEISLECMRETDIIGRIGGEEFAIIAIGSTTDATFQVAERIRLRLEAEDFKLGRKLTISGGVAGFPSQGATVDELFVIADKSLYEAKSRQRNLILIAEEARG